MRVERDIKKIRDVTNQFFEKMGFDVEPEVSIQERKEPPTFSIDLKMEDPQILIGEGGKTLFQIQHLLKAILRKELDYQFYINLDILGYKEKKAEYLRKLAKSVADSVALDRKERELSPMPAWERRIIHLELSQREDVITESIGTEPERRVVIKPNKPSGDISKKE